ncbi:MAG TPA: hypothetical protein VHE37_08280, partial [Nevskiaceae bacterium]|nr:hypothetical protein [Nevskiaceae bacterium]
IYDPSVGKTDEADNLLATLAQHGMELPPARREHAILRASGRVQYIPADIELAKKAALDLSRLEGLVPSIQSAYVIGWAMDEATRMAPEQVIVVMLTESAERDLLRMNQALGDLT